MVSEVSARGFWLRRSSERLNGRQTSRSADGGDSIEKVLQVVSSYLLNKVARTATGTVGWILLTAMKANMSSVPRCHTSVRCAEMFGRTRVRYIGFRTRTPWP